MSCALCPTPFAQQHLKLLGPPNSGRSVAEWAPSLKRATDACVLASNNASPAQRGPRRDAQPLHATPLAAVLFPAPLGLHTFSLGAGPAHYAPRLPSLPTLRRCAPTCRHAGARLQSDAQAAAQKGGEQRRPRPVRHAQGGDHRGARSRAVHGDNGGEGDRSGAEGETSRVQPASHNRGEAGDGPPVSPNQAETGGDRGAARGAPGGCEEARPDASADPAPHLHRHGAHPGLPSQVATAGGGLTDGTARAVAMGQMGCCISCALWATTFDGETGRVSAAHDARRAGARRSARRPHVGTSRVSLSAPRDARGHRLLFCMPRQQYTASSYASKAARTDLLLALALAVALLALVALGLALLLLLAARVELAQQLQHPHLSRLVRSQRSERVGQLVCAGSGQRARVDRGGAAQVKGVLDGREARVGARRGEQQLGELLVPKLERVLERRGARAVRCRRVRAVREQSCRRLPRPERRSEVEQRDSALVSVRRQRGRQAALLEPAQHGLCKDGGGAKGLAALCPRLVEWGGASRLAVGRVGPLLCRPHHVRGHVWREGCVRLGAGGQQQHPNLPRPLPGAIVGGPGRVHAAGVERRVE